MSLFRWLLNNLNGPTEELRGKNLLTKIQPDPTVDETSTTVLDENVAAVLDEFLSTQKTYSRSELLDWSHTKDEPADKISARSNGEQSVGGGRKLLGETFSLFSFLSLFSLSLLFCWRLSLCSKKP